MRKSFSPLRAPSAFTKIVYIIAKYFSLRILILSRPAFLGMESVKLLVFQIFLHPDTQEETLTLEQGRTMHDFTLSSVFVLKVIYCCWKVNIHHLKTFLLFQRHSGAYTKPKRLFPEQEFPREVFKMKIKAWFQAGKIFSCIVGKQKQVFT